GQQEEGNKAERDRWKKYAATTAANFTIHWISQAWPTAPRRTRQSSASTPSEETNDDDSPAAGDTVNAVDAVGLSGPQSGIRADKKDASNSLLATAADLARVAPDFLRMVLAAAAGQMERSGHASSSGLDAELEAIKGFIDRHQNEAAEARL